MSQHRGPLLLILLAVLLVGGGYASPIHRSAINCDFGFHSAYAIYSSTSTDNWLGGIGNWSDPSYWDFGLPSGDSDVIIHSGGFDLVYLDTSASIASLTLGGDNGSSQLIDNGTAQTLTIAGALTINQTGALYLATGSTVTAGANSSNAGLIQLENGSALQVNGNLSNAGTIYLGYLASSAGNLSVTGELDNTGVLQLGRIDGLSFGSAANLGSLVNSGSITLGPGTTLRVNGEVNNSGGIGVGSYDAVAGNQAYFGSLVNSGGVEVGLGSALTVAGNVNNTSTGAIGLDGVSQLSIGGSVINNGSLTSGMQAGWGGGWINVNGGLTNSGEVLLRDGAQLVVLGDAINSGTIRIFGSDPESIASSNAVFGSLVNSGTIQVGYASGFSTGTLTNTGTIVGDHPYEGNVGAGNLNNSGVITVGGLEAGSNVINSGSIQLDYAEIGGNFTNSGNFSLFGLQEMPGILNVHGNLTNSGQFTADGSIGATNVNIGGRLFNTPTGTVLMNRAMNVFDAGSVVNQGTLSLGWGNTFNVTGGLHAGASALSGFTNTGIVNIGPYSNLNVVGNYTQIAGQTNLYETGTLQVQGRGMAVFAGGSVYSEFGTISGPVFSNAAISLYQLSILGNYTQGPNGSLTFDIAGTGPGEFDQLNISGHAQLNGLMTVDLLHGFVPDLGDAFDIVHFASESGTFSMVLGLPINGEEHFVLEYNASDLTLDVVPGALVGADSGEPILIASNGTSDNTSSDRSSITSSIASDYRPSSTTPEPGSLLLLGSGLLCVGYSVRRRMTK